MGKLEERVKTALARARRGRQGQLARIETSLGRYPGHLAALSHPGHRLHFDDCEEAAQALGEDPLCLVHRATSPLDVEGLLGELPAPRGLRILRELKSAARRVQQAEGLVQPIQEVAQEEIASLAAALREGAVEVRVGWLNSDPRYRSLPAVLAAARTLDRHRHTNPLATIRMARALATGVCPRLRGSGSIGAFCRAASALASAHRVTGAHQLAAAIFKIQLPLTHSTGDAHLLADTYQRIAYVFYNNLRWEDALTLAREAGRIYFGLGDRAGMGQTLTDLGIFSYCKGDLADARSYLRFALDVLPAAGNLTRMATNFSLARVARELGQYGEALKHFQKAESLLASNQPLNRACFLYARGEVHQAATELEAAIACFREARDLFREADPCAAAIAGLDLVRALLENGRTAAAVQETRSLAALVQPLAQHPLAAEALRDLVRLSAQVRLQDLVETRTAVERARPWARGPLPAS